jgi:hypothetical protein
MVQNFDGVFFPVLLAILGDRYQTAGCFFTHVNGDRHPEK